MRKDLEDIEQKKNEMIAGMSRKDIAKDGKEFEQLLKNYKQLVETEELIKEGQRKRGPLDTFIKVGTLAASVVGAIFVPVVLADVAYKGEKDMSLKNGSIWNLIGKDFSPKNKNNQG